METAEEFLKNYTPTNDDRYDWYSPEQCIEAMIEFAKGHVEEALQEACHKAELDLISNYTKCEISDKSILESYSLDNIK